MNIVLLSGGSGKRLWPLSNDIRSKQFIPIFKIEEGKYESMVQRVYRQIRSIDSEAVITIATSKKQVSAIHNQLGENVNICVEPCRRDTFPAIVLAAAYMRDIQGLGDDDVIVVCPVDAYAERDYFEALQEMERIAMGGGADLVMMGIEPTYPSEKYGYIIPEVKERINFIKAFYEKPDSNMAEKYIREGALWNGGVFAFKIGYVLKKAREALVFEDYEDLYVKYKALPANSFDYEVAEKEKRGIVLRYSGKWKDLGTWNTLTEVMGDACIGKAILSDNCENVNVINELDVPVLCMGLKNVVISVSSEGILVSDKEQTSYIKGFVDQMGQQVMFADKSWGNFQVLDVEEESMTIKVTLRPGCSMNYHSHERRDEVWAVISGQGKTIVDGMEEPVQTGDVITMQAGCRHTVIADTDLKIIEVQMGKEISVSDKKKFPLDD